MSSLLYLSLPLWSTELYDEIIEKVKRLKQLRWSKGQGLCMEGHDCLKTNKNLCLLTAVRYVHFKG